MVEVGIQVYASHNTLQIVGTSAVATANIEIPGRQLRLYDDTAAARYDTVRRRLPAGHSRHPWPSAGTAVLRVCAVTYSALEIVQLSNLISQTASLCVLQMIM